MNPTLVVSVLSALAAAVWSVWTWREEQQKERQIKRDQESALFVNSFILAAAVCARYTDESWRDSRFSKILNSWRNG
jgi:hypothetical protein